MISENYRIVTLTPPFDMDAASTHTVFNMGKAHKATIVVIGGALTAVDVTMTVKCGATAGTATTDLFSADEAVYLKSTNADVEAVNGDLFVTSLTLTSGQKYYTLPATDKRMYVLELDASRVPSATPWVKVEFSAGTGAFLGCAFAILQMRYKKDTTVIGA
jgi:hypothetical protein